MITGHGVTQEINFTPEQYYNTAYIPIRTPQLFATEIEFFHITNVPLIRSIHQNCFVDNHRSQAIHRHCRRSKQSEQTATESCMIPFNNYNYHNELQLLKVLTFDILTDVAFNFCSLSIATCGSDTPKFVHFCVALQ